MAEPASADALAEGILVGDRRALARAITLVESTRPDHRDRADELLTALLPRTGASLRIGISGPPGVGKSTFIEALGLHAVRSGHRLAVLAVDPSSNRTGGSILGDKTRMPELSRHPAAYIRPSPGGGELGGPHPRAGGAASAAATPRSARCMTGCRSRACLSGGTSRQTCACNWPRKKPCSI